jgi:hypothetical protein
MDLDPDSDPAIFIIDLQDANKKLIFKSFFGFYFFKVHLHHFSKIFFFCLMIEGSVSIPLTNGSGSRRPKTYGSGGPGSGSATLKIRIRISRQKPERIPHFRTRGLGEVHADGPPPVPAGLRLPEADAQVREGVQEDRQTELHVCLGAR